MTRKMTEEISPSLQGSKTKLKFTFSTRILNLTFLEKRNKKNQTKWRLHTKKKRRIFSRMGNKNYKNLGIPSEGTRNNRIFSGQFPSGCIPFLNNTGKSGSIDSFQESVGIHLGAIERRVARSACLRFEPRGTDNNGGLEAWSWDEARTCAFRVLSGETNNDCDQSPSQPLLDQRWTTPGRVTCAPSGMCMIALSKKGGQPASVEHLHVLEDIFGLVQWLGRNWS